MQFRSIVRIIGLVLMLFSLVVIPPVLLNYIFNEQVSVPFVETFFALMGSGLVLFALNKNASKELRRRDAFLIIGAFWLVLSVAGSLPFWLGAVHNLDPLDGMFEAVAGLSTTHANVLTALDYLPKSVLFYRQELQWLGGLGVIILAVALYPVLGVGGMQLYKSDTPGPMKDERLNPRIMQTAREMSIIYLGITIICAAAYAFVGMTPFDSIAHALSTVSTGGFSTHDAGLGYYHSVLVEDVAMFFMFVGGINFALHFVAWRNKDIWSYFSDPQFRVYFWGMLSFGVLASAYLFWSNTYSNPSEAFHQGFFAIISMQSTAGFTVAPISAWPGALPTLLILIGFVGGCAGSTSGGMKVIRWQLVLKQAGREIRRLVHPNAIIFVKFADQRVPGRVLSAITGFFAIYLALFAILMLSMLAVGVDQVTAWSSVAACLNNAGPGLGLSAQNFAHLPDLAKGLCIIAMLIGRLEVFTFIVLLTPTYWRG
jgi:trk system potassium uptake protein TrkH